VSLVILLTKVLAGRRLQRCSHSLTISQSPGATSRQHNYTNTSTSSILSSRDILSPPQWQQPTAGTQPSRQPQQLQQQREDVREAEAAGAVLVVVGQLAGPALPVPTAAISRYGCAAACVKLQRATLSHRQRCCHTAAAAAWAQQQLGAYVLVVVVEGGVQGEEGGVGQVVAASS
jgi:hypothetical protein